MSKILLVDDDAFIVEAYSQKLEQAGFEIGSAADGMAAVKMLPAFKPDLIVLDLMLPRFSGFELLNYMRTRSDLQGIKVVVLSNFYLGDPERQAAASDADATLMKSSCNPSQLVDTINELLYGKTAPAPSPAPVDVLREFESEAQTGNRQDFLKNAPVTLATLRQLNDAFIQSENSRTRALRLLNFYRKVHFMTAMAGLLGFEAIARMASALEALLLRLHEEPDNISPSALQTIAYSLDFFRLLYAHADRPSATAKLQARVLVVDDDAVSARAVVTALRNARLDASSVQDPAAALTRLEQETFELIVLDVEMPGMDGFALCKKIRAEKSYKKTPIIFVTSHNDFESRIHSVLSGGDDLISKPIFPIELAVKAVTHLLRRQLPESSVVA
jgi:DNA-binding response OmpR family regulator